MNTMRLVFAIALALHGTANAANLRRVAAETGATVADATLVDTLAGKYDCRQAGATLAETLQNVANKNGQQLEALDIECQERTANITVPWTRAQETYATEFPKVEEEEVEQFDTDKNVADETFQTLEKNRTDVVEIQQIDYTGKKDLFDTAVDAYTTAKNAWENEKELKESSETKFNTVTLPDGTKLNAKICEASKQSANATMNGLITAATELKATADKICTEIKNDREKYILADEELLNDIGPLIKELSKLKCVDSYDATKAAAGAATGTIGFVQVDANVAAQCAMLSNKITALLALSQQRSPTTATDAPIMGQLDTFTARVSEEKKHMETLFDTCTTKASTIFHAAKTNATDQMKIEVDGATAVQTAADERLTAARDLLIQTNTARVDTKAKDMKAPLATKVAADKDATTALAKLVQATKTRDTDIPLAKTAHEATVLAAENLKIANIKTRQAGLEGTKKDAKATFEEEEIFLTEYCESKESDLKKELVLVNQIFCKLGGLQVTDTAAITGLLEAEQNEEEQATPTVLVCPAPEPPSPIDCTPIVNAATVQCTTASDQTVLTCDPGYNGAVGATACVENVCNAKDDAAAWAAEGCVVSPPITFADKLCSNHKEWINGDGSKSWEQCRAACAAAGHPYFERVDGGDLNCRCCTDGVTFSLSGRNVYSTHDATTVTSLGAVTSAAGYASCAITCPTNGEAFTVAAVVNTCTAKANAAAWAALGCTVAGTATGNTIALLGDVTPAIGYQSCAITCPADEGAFTVAAVECTPILNAATVQCTTASDQTVLTCDPGYNGAVGATACVENVCNAKDDAAAWAAEGCVVSPPITFADKLCSNHKEWINGDGSKSWEQCRAACAAAGHPYFERVDGGDLNCRCCTDGVTFSLSGRNVYSTHDATTVTSLGAVTSAAGYASCAITCPTNGEAFTVAAVVNTCTAKANAAAWAALGCTVAGTATGNTIALLGDVTPAIGTRSCAITCPVDGGAFTVTAIRNIPNAAVLKNMVSDWLAGGDKKDALVKKYGSIENWDTSEVTSLASVFRDQKTFNADISKWDVSSVKSMYCSTSFLANC